jgi:predicted esterase
MNEHTLSFQFQARYFKSAEITPTTKAVWFVLHGYGQLAQYFLSKFNILKDHNICVIAPEGLSRFYLEDVASRSQSGNTRVGATWMTREGRLTDIENYITYLTSVYEAEVKGTELPVTILGFSQGAATASRWAISDKVRFNNLVLWAGLLPPDMDFEKGLEVLHNKKVSFVYGKHDPFLNDSRFDDMNKLSSKLNIQPDVLTFHGGHEIHGETLLKLL